MKHIIEGITIGPDRLQVTQYRSYAKTGITIIRPNGEVKVTVFSGASGWQRQQTVAMAERIWMYGRAAFDADCWRYVDGLGWVTTVFVREPRTIAEREAAVLAELAA